jgi:hypothetical protein
MSKEKYKEEFERIGGEDAIVATRDFLELYVEYLKKHEPYATNSINLFQNAVDELPSDLEFLEEE